MKTKQKKTERKREEQKENLNNTTKGKTKRTIQYIEGLEPLMSWTTTQKQKFDNKIEKALRATTANGMLKAIGYRYNKTPRIYERI